jgi:NADH:ubiquinone oxidoreductase subunit
MSFLSRTFTWWNSQTWGTWWHTMRRGERVGDDAQGNVYYKDRKGPRRWVIYNGDIEASRVPPEWHAWLHYTVNDVPLEQKVVIKPWEKPHVANLTGSEGAYFPPALTMAASAPRRRAIMKLGTLTRNCAPLLRGYRYGT